MNDEPIPNKIGFVHLICLATGSFRCLHNIHINKFGQQAFIILAERILIKSDFIVSARLTEKNNMSE